MSVVIRLQFAFDIFVKKETKNISYFRRPVRIEAFLESSLREVITKVEDLNETFWRLHIDCYLANNTQSRIYGRMELTLDSYPKGIFFLDVSPNFQGEMVWTYHIDFNKVTNRT